MGIDYVVKTKGLCVVKKIDICICTYKRPSLLKELLESINNCQSVGDTNVRIVVVDNDNKESARKAVNDFKTKSKYEVIYSLESQKNISAARNKCLDIAKEADYVIFLDDDECVSESWLLHLLETQERFSADVVIAPVITKYLKGTPDWVVKSKVFERKRRRTGQALKTGNTGNALITKKVIHNVKGFDLEYGLSGGEDSEFFRRVRESGSLIVWCDEAEVYEFLAEDRMSLTYIYKRANRGGQTTAILNKKNMNKIDLIGHFFKKCLHVLIAGSLVVLCSALGKKSIARWVSKLAASIGQISGLFGKKREMY